MSRRTILIITSVSLLGVAAALFFCWLFRPLAPLDGRAALAGLQQSVSVAFDEQAVPYIEGNTDDDVYEAQGYITARDRLFQMDMLRRLAYGRMSEVFGSAWLPSDRLMETLGISGLSYTELGKLSAPAKAALEAYARGVNAYLSESAGKLPHEFALLGYMPATWSAQDSLAILKYEAYQVDESWRLDDLRQRIANRVGTKLASRLFNDNLLQAVPPAPETPAAEDGTDSNTSTPTNEPRTKPSGVKDQPAKTSLEQQPTGGFNRTGAPTPALDSMLWQIAQDGDKAAAAGAGSVCLGSTTWAVPAGVSTTHGAMLACNKDGVLSNPCQWYLCSLNSASLHVAGASLPGVPSIIIGRNESFAFGSSALKADVQDIFLEKFKSPFDRSYQTEKGWQAADVETRTIPVRFGGDVEHKVVITRHGPLLLRSGSLGVSLSWTGFDTDQPTYQAIFDLNYAGTKDQILKALKEYADPPMMYIFADRAGNTFCQAAGEIPTRAAAQGTMLNPGWLADGQWGAYLAFDKLPHVDVTATDTKPLVAANQSFDAQLGHQFDPPYRAERLMALLSQRKTPVSLADMVALSGDEYSSLAPLLAKTLKAVLQSQHVEDRNSVVATDLLDKWDGQLQSTSMEASIYEAFMQTLARRLVEPVLGRQMAVEYMNRYGQWPALVQWFIQNQPSDWLPPEERTFATFISTTLTQSLKSLHVAFDTNNVAQWNWGNIHQTKFEPTAKALPWPAASLAGLPAAAAGGAPECINSFGVTIDPASINWSASVGPQERLLVDMSDQDKFYQSICTGESGNFLSPHHTDQMNIWAAADFKPIAFSGDQVLRQCKHRLTLAPE